MGIIRSVGYAGGGTLKMKESPVMGLGLTLGVTGLVPCP